MTAEETLQQSLKGVPAFVDTWQHIVECMEQYGKQQSMAFSIWMKENSCREGQDLWTCRFTRWKERHTISELYDLFQQQKQK